MEDHTKRRQEEPKQVIVVRKELNMPQGKLAAQVAHASLGALLNGSYTKRTGKTIEINLEEGTPEKKWLEERFTKVVLYVKTEEKLLKVYEKAKEKGLPTSLIKDAGFTYFDKPTYTCVGIGPCFPGDLIGITDKLRVL